MDTLTPQLATFALTSAVLGVHLILLALWTGTVRTMRQRFVNPEDSAIIKGTFADGDHPDTLRVKRAHMNALENAVPFFIVGALYVATGASETGASAYFYTFLAARLLHSVFYLFGKQPFRTLCFGIGALVVLGMAVHVIRATI